MNAISLSSRLSDNGSVVVYDVGVRIKSWGLRGILSGGIFGFVLGAMFVAIPFTADVLTFGVLGTLAIGTLECAAVGGGFGAFAAAVFGQGIARGNTIGLSRALPMRRLPLGARRREDDIAVLISNASGSRNRPG